MVLPHVAETALVVVPVAPETPVNPVMMVGFHLGGTEARFLDIRLLSGGSFEELVPAGLNALLVIYDGAIAFGDGQVAASVTVAVLGEGERVAFRNAGQEEAGVLLIAGRPLNESVAWGGPFVMNTREQVMQAARDYHEGRF